MPFTRGGKGCDSHIRRLNIFPSFFFAQKSVDFVPTASSPGRTVECAVCLGLRQFHWMDPGRLPRRPESVRRACDWSEPDADIRDLRCHPGTDRGTCLAADAGDLVACGEVGR